MMKKVLLLLWLLAMPFSSPLWASPTADLNLVGQGSMRWLFRGLYQARFYSADGQYRAGDFPQALVLRYQRDIGKEDLLDATVTEWQRRVWYIEKSANGHYSGTADDVVVPAKGQARGGALNWRYTLSVPVDGQTWNIDFNDWMYLLDDNRVLNRAEMTKWGFKVGEVILWIERKNGEG
ncbi:DUF3833 family protein [Oceanisphaera sp. KMM 10153]|uniref:DUF3833 family protein n=1 Tax=Oceanisphaera submarina TaxID=3390193 RepID=UPI0039772093